jgi:acyl dehydratase
MGNGLSYFQSFVGKSSSPVKNEVEKGAIRRFAEAIGDGNPLYRDESYAATTSYGRISAPPTFSRTFDCGQISGFELPAEGLIHGEQGFEYFHPIYAGDVVLCTTSLKDVFARDGKLGTMIFLVMEQEVMNEAGDLLLRETSTIIYREGAGQK